MSEYISIVGHWSADGGFELRPCYPRPTGELRDPADDLALAEAIGPGGDTLGRWGLAVFDYVDSGTGNRVIRGAVPLPDDAVRLRFSAPRGSQPPEHGPTVLAEVGVPSSAPEVRIIEGPSARADGRIGLTWEAHGDPPPVEYRVHYSVDGERWIPVALRLDAHRLDVDTDELPGGDRCLLRVTATDGVRSASAQSEPFSVPLKRCRSFIVHPHDGGVYSGEVLLAGNGWWLEGDRPEVDQLLWVSDVDGTVGRGRSVLARLSAGRHRITLVAGRGDRAGSSDVRVVITEAAHPDV